MNVTDVPCSLYLCFCPHGCLLMTSVSLQKPAEPIEMPFGTWTQGTTSRWGANWRHLMNMSERSVREAVRPYVQLLRLLVIIIDEIYIAQIRRQSKVLSWQLR